MIKAVIFDRDGVLIDSEYTNVKAAELAFGEFGIQLTEDEKKWIVGRHPLDYTVPLMEKYDFDFDKYREIQRAKYRQVLESTPVFEKTIELLKQIHKKGLLIALCTSSNRPDSIKILDGLGIRGLFTEIVTKEDYLKSKPNPEPYLVAAKKLGVKPTECLVVEDSEMGLKSALSAGMKCIVIFNGYTKGHDFSGALKVVGSADEIELEEIFS